MGDAGPRIIDTTIHHVPIEAVAPQTQSAVRDIHVLVTGFGPFKSFSTNPSYLIASSLPKELDPLPLESLRISTVPKPAAQPIQHPLAALLGRPVILHHKTPEPPIVPQPLRPPNTQPYCIHVHTWPAAIHVAYAPTSTLIPSLLDPRTNRPFYVDFDYVLHIGLASGRDSYTLETNAHRDEYDIKDVDDQEGYLPGEKIWKSLDPPIPERLDVGWLPGDVLAKWEAEVERRQNVMEQELDRMLSELAKGNEKVREQLLNNGSLKEKLIGRHTREQYIRRPRRAVVKLSRDAGRYLCEFILMCSLVHRYRDARGDFTQNDADNEDQDEDFSTAPSTTVSPSRRREQKALERVGKVAFLHVPNGTELEDIERGKMVAESAIQAIVASWEAGYRNPHVYALQTITERAKISLPIDNVLMPQGTDANTALHATTTPTMRIPHESAIDSAFETKGTGDS